MSDSTVHPAVLAGMLEWGTRWMGSKRNGKDVATVVDRAERCYLCDFVMHAGDPAQPVMRGICVGCSKDWKA